MAGLSTIVLLPRILDVLVDFLVFWALLHNYSGHSWEQYSREPCVAIRFHGNHAETSAAATGVSKQQKYSHCVGEV